MATFAVSGVVLSGSSRRRRPGLAVLSMCCSGVALVGLGLWTNFLFGSGEDPLLIVTWGPAALAALALVGWALAKWSRERGEGVGLRESSTHLALVAIAATHVMLLLELVLVAISVLFFSTIRF